MTAFSNFKLLPSLQKTLNEKEFRKTTEIQAEVIPLMLSQKSVVGVSETGSGKTLAFALPILHQLKTLEVQGSPVEQEAHPRALVVVPTRELGEQVTRVFKPFTHDTRLRVRSLLGGTTMELAKRNIKGKFEVLVATPGRLLQFLDRGLVNLSDVRILIFDETDQMLDQGFLNDAKSIASACSADPQKGLFSATISPAVENLIGSLFSEAQIFRSKGSHRLVSTLSTENRKVPNGIRLPILEKILSKKVEGGTLIFTNTREQCDKLFSELTKLKKNVVIYRGEMDKVERRKNLKLFREAKVDLLIATDLGSRGLDLEHVGRVINYHLPQQMENYIHRVGRTARAGRKGLVINFVTERDEPLMRQVEKLQSRK